MRIGCQLSLGPEEALKDIAFVCYSTFTNEETFKCLAVHMSLPVRSTAHMHAPTKVNKLLVTLLSHNVKIINSLVAQMA